MNPWHTRRASQEPPATLALSFDRMAMAGIRRPPIWLLCGQVNHLAGADGLTQ
jgi:hypothetical protein